jgi:hypothetical protein
MFRQHRRRRHASSNENERVSATIDALYTDLHLRVRERQVERPMRTRFLPRWPAARHGHFVQSDSPTTETTVYRYASTTCAEG